MKIEQVFNVCSIYSQRNYLTSADYSNAYQSRGYPLNKKEVKKMNELKKIPTAERNGKNGFKALSVLWSETDN